ncbi:MAG: hypothetical protein R8K49_04785 [Mariprofundaceae bacterium]
MHKNQLTAAIEFYYQGKCFNFSTVLDVDVWLHTHQADMEALYDLIAGANGLDRYRHEYDVMVLEPISFSEASGMVVDYVNSGEFDVAGFQAAVKQKKAIDTLQEIAQKHLDIDNIEAHPKLTAALLEAYHSKP